MGKRFKRLDYTLKALRAPNSTAAAPDAPAGTIAKNYQDFAAGKKNLSYPRDEASKPGSLLEVSIRPFFFGGADGSETIVTQSKRADDEGTLDAIQTACNQVTVDIEAHQERKRFFPAQAIVTVVGASETTKTSQITGIQYSKKASASYTFPYGASATEKAEGNVRKEILTAAKALVTASVSFSTEKA